jgi:pimeloyl-ACP methyl ester carboxylesterase
LEDFARLWVCGLTTNVLAALPSGCTVTLNWGDVGSPNSGNPTIDLFQAVDSDGGIGYLTNATSAARQIVPAYAAYVGRLAPGKSLQLNAGYFSGWAGNHFIWCGVTNGTGKLNLTIADAHSNVLSQTSTYIQLVDIKQMYERWTVGENPSVAPTTYVQLATNDLPATLSQPFRYSQPGDANTPYILFVHGWNMETWEKDRFAETAFKRLYWQGYQGRFGEFRWPTGFDFTGWKSVATDPDNFDNSEYQAWQSAQGLLNKLNELNAQYPNHIYLLAHSMGNIVAGDALRRAGNNQIVKTYVASQAAVTAHTYDTNIANYSFTVNLGGVNVPFGPNTPNIYGNWFAGNSGGGAGQVINFYNVNDYALSRLHWQLDQLFKPDQGVLKNGDSWTYHYNGNASDPSPWNHFSKYNETLFYTMNFDIVNVLTNRYEVMAYAAQAYTTALGATPGVLNLNRNVDLTRSSPTQIWPPDNSTTDPTKKYAVHFWHSAEFRGDYSPMQGYWSELLGSEAFNLK